jgi:hypothetical protein
MRVRSLARPATPAAGRAEPAHDWQESSWLEVIDLCERDQWLDALAKAHSLYEMTVPPRRAGKVHDARKRAIALLNKAFGLKDS